MKTAHFRGGHMDGKRMALQSDVEFVRIPVRPGVFGVKLARVGKAAQPAVIMQIEDEVYRRSTVSPHIYVHQP